MREIKFRFWMGNYAKPIYEYSDNLIKLEQERDCPILADYLMTKRVEIVKEQYTGLKDKKGVEIYEGDILSLYGKYNGKIVYRIGSFFFEEKTGRHTPLCMFNPIDSEVIGNIHDKEKEDE